MKKEHFIFLTLLLCAAIIIGSTIGLTSNLKYIVNQMPEKKIEAAPLEQEQGPSNKSQIENDISSEKAENNEIINRTSGQILYYIGNNLTFSQEEKQEVTAMLASLGAEKKGDYSQFIREFQRKKGLTPTGTLDDLTLNAIINEITKQRAQQRFNECAYI